MLEVCETKLLQRKPLGVMILAVSARGSTRNGTRLSASAAVAALKDLGYTTVGAEAPVVDDATIKVGARQDCARPVARRW